RATCRRQAWAIETMSRVLRDVRAGLRALKAENAELRELCDRRAGDARRGIGDGEWSGPVPPDTLGLSGWAVLVDFLIGGCEPRSGEAGTVLAESSVLVVQRREVPERRVASGAVVEGFDVFEHLGHQLAARRPGSAVH